MENITVESAINAPVEKVWEHFTEPRYVEKWNNASEDWYTPKAENDLRVGGSFRYRMEAKDGTTGFDFGGIYDEIVPNKLIRYTMGDGRKVEVTFTAEGQQTLVKEIFDTENQNSLEVQKNGWQAILNNFKREVESS
jgi:uncharacterized protein YndB with AHSA1/START domain